MTTAAIGKLLNNPLRLSLRLTNNKIQFNSPWLAKFSRHGDTIATCNLHLLALISHEMCSKS
jgi:hypothetical protein